MNKEQKGWNKFLNPNRITDYIQVSQLRKEIDREGLPLDLEVILPAFSALSYSHKVPLEQFRDSMSPHQLYSKVWMIRSILEILDLFERSDDNSIELLRGLKIYQGDECNFAYFGSWLGFGPALVAGAADFFDSSSINNITLVDRDEVAMKYASGLLLSLGYNLRCITNDMEDIDPRDYVFQSDIIVNPACEHLSQGVFDRWWSKVVASRIEDNKRLIILQSTDMEADDHINKCHNVENLIPHDLVPLYTGRLQFADCSRFMVIGTL